MITWDDEVDVVCYGWGPGATASAVTADDDDADVLIVRPDPLAASPSTAGGSAVVLVAEADDAETRDYLDALVADVGESAVAARDVAIQSRTVSERGPIKAGQRIAPFYGARLRDWAADCLASPFGVLYTRLLDRGATAMRTHSGDEVDVRFVGELESDRGAGAVSAVNQWLLAQVQQRDIDVLEGSSLQRIVTEEGEITGVVIVTPDGRRAVRARHGIAISTASAPITTVAGDRPLAGSEQPRVALVGHSASRFGRVELLTTEAFPADIKAAYCQPVRAEDRLRDRRRSPARRGREVHRYPPFG